MRSKSFYIVEVGIKQLGVYGEEHAEWIIDLRDYAVNRKIEDIDVGKWEYYHWTLRCSIHDNTWLCLS